MTLGKFILNIAEARKTCLRVLIDIPTDNRAERIRLLARAETLAQVLEQIKEVKI